MDYITITADMFNELSVLQSAYKADVGEDAPSDDDFVRLKNAIDNNQIIFYGCRHGGMLIACCSICKIFSTFNFRTAGVFEDFYILPEFRHRGIARKLVRYAYEKSAIHSITVGCADCDVEMYKALGFSAPLGNMLAFEC